MKPRTLQKVCGGGGWWVVVMVESDFSVKLLAILTIKHNHLLISLALLSSGLLL